MGPSPSSKKKIQVDLESRRSVERFKDDHAFIEFENKFKDNRTFEEFENKKIQVDSESRRLVKQFEDNHAFEELEFQANRAQKLGLIFIYYKSEDAGQSGQEIGIDLHLLQVQGCRPIGSGNWEWSSPTIRPIGSGNSNWSSKSPRSLGQSGPEIWTRPTPKRDC